MTATAHESPLDVPNRVTVTDRIFASRRSLSPSRRNEPHDRFVDTSIAPPAAGRRSDCHEGSRGQATSPHECKGDQRMASAPAWIRLRDVLESLEIGEKCERARLAIETCLRCRAGLRGARACLAPVVRTERSAQQHRGVRFRGAGNVCRRRRRLRLGVRTAGAPPAACRAQAAGRKPSHRMRWLGDRLAMGRSRLRPWCGWESGDLHHRARASDHAGPFRHRHGCHDRGVEIGGVPARRRTNSRLPGWG
jgi:hypothetical protein